MCVCVFKYNTVSSSVLVWRASYLLCPYFHLCLFLFFSNYQTTSVETANTEITNEGEGVFPLPRGEGEERLKVIGQRGIHSEGG